MPKIFKWLSWLWFVLLFFIVTFFNVRLYQARYAVKLDRSVSRVMAMSDKDEVRRLIELQDAVTNPETLEKFVAYLQSLEKKHGLTDGRFMWDIGIGD